MLDSASISPIEQQLAYRPSVMGPKLVFVCCIRNLGGRLYCDLINLDLFVAVQTPKLRVQQTYTYFGQISRNVQTEGSSMYFIIAGLTTFLLLFISTLFLV